MRTLSGVQTLALAKPSKGPAAITEDETTIILPASRHAIRQADGCIDITRMKDTP